MAQINGTDTLDGRQRPMQTVPWSEKTPDWFKSNIKHFIGRAGFNRPLLENPRDLGMLYDVYNNKFPLSWFDHITNPLNAVKEQHKKFPAKVRPTTILRTNIDLLLGEYRKRPFIYNVSNLGDSGYSRYMESMQQQAQQILTDHFTRAALEQMQARGQEITPEQMQKLQSDPPVPEEVKKQFKSSYKDAIAIKGQKYLKRQIRELKMRQTLQTMFKDWLITGEAYSYKGIENETTVYRRVSPLCIDYDKSHSSDMIEDGEWVVYRDRLVLSDIIDRFYMDLSMQNIKDLETGYIYSSPTQLYDYIRGRVPGYAPGTTIPIYHVQWKGRKKIGFLSYLDMETFQYVEKTVDENYVVDREAGEQIEWRWVNEVYQGWQISEDIYCGMEACPIQRNEMNNHSTCKLSYNGRRHSDTHSANISVLELGIPFQIMYIIIGYTLEKTIAKSKGKIVMLDKKSVPNDGDWDEEKFFYYGDALGFALIDRSQPGVDKSFNQYQVLDLSLFENIKQLIELQEHYKQQWDDIIGITRQRKGQTYASDGQGVNERSVFQSTVITDMIFLGFEEFVQSDLQGILDLCKFTTSKGVYSLYNDDDYGTTILEIMPEDFMDEELGVFITDASEELRKLSEMKQYAQAMAQNGAKASTVLEVIDASNIAELKQVLRYIEDIQMQVEQQSQQAEFDAQAAADERAQRLKAYDALLERQNMEAEYDRKEDIEMIKGTFNTFTFQNGDSNANGTPDALEVQKILENQTKMMNDIDQKNKDRKVKTDKLADDRKQMEHQMKMDMIESRQRDQKLKIDKKKASQRPKAAAKK